jgi:hypothetical protein
MSMLLSEIKVPEIILSEQCKEELRVFPQTRKIHLNLICLLNFSDWNNLEKRENLLKEVNIQILFKLNDNICGMNDINMFELLKGSDKYSNLKLVPLPNFNVITSQVPILSNFSSFNTMVVSTDYPFHDYQRLLMCFEYPSK